MTNLEKLVFSHLKWKALCEEVDKKEKQVVLDEITEEVLEQLSVDDICRHVREIYDETVEEYETNPHTKNVVDELLDFMSLIPNEERVVDVGCGAGRDTLFMACDNSHLRAMVMQREKDGERTIDKYDIPSHKFIVFAIDSSIAMVEMTKQKIMDANKPIGTVLADAYQMDMHGFADKILNYYDAGLKRKFDGVWSCTALFTHTPQSLCRSAMEQVSQILKPKGIFFVSYTNGRAEGRYNKLLMSSTGHIKYFSQPLPEDIVQLAEEYGLRLMVESFADFVINGKVLKENLFVSQFFEKVD